MTTDELLKDAKAFEPAFRSMMQGAAFEADAEPNYGPPKKGGGDFALKDKGSMERKVETKGTHPSAMSDAVRGTIIADTPEQISKAADALRARVHAMGGKLRIDNKFREGVRNRNPYRAVHADILSPIPGTDRMIRSEVQLQLRDFHDGTMESPKEQVHKIYELAREGKVDQKSARAAMQLIITHAYQQTIKKMGRRKT